MEAVTDLTPLGAGLAIGLGAIGPGLAIGLGVQAAMNAIANREPRAAARPDLHHPSPRVLT